MCVEFYLFYWFSSKGSDVLSESGEGAWGGELGAAASTEEAEWGVSNKASVLHSGLGCESVTFSLA